MRKPASPLRLQPESNLVVDAQRHYRSSRIRRNHHTQPVFQSLILDRYLQLFHSGLLKLLYTFFPLEIVSKCFNIIPEACARTQAANLQVARDNFS